MASGSPWNSLEVAKIVVGAATPIAVVVMGFIVQRTLARHDREWKARQRLADRRMTIYDEIRQDLNRIYCFIEDVGSWKEETPDTLIAYKRKSDQVMHGNRAFWSLETVSAYFAYMRAAFEPYQGVGLDARIRTNDHQKKVGIAEWTPAWSDRLTGEVDREHRTRHAQLIALISGDLMLREERATTARPPTA
jgi:hypothetical protein